jgi:signal transduction histidine kinase
MNEQNSSQFNILLVDDEELIRNLLKKALSKEGHNILEATSKQDAFDVFSNNTLDLLVVDKNLPDGSGLEFIEAVRNLDFDGEIIVITGYSDTDSAIKSVELGVFRYVRKPFDLDALKMDIKRALETATLRKTLSNRTLQLEQTNTELRETLTKFKESEHRRIQTERLASIGYLSSGIAHEINNPLSLLSMTIPHTLLELNKIITSSILTSDPESVSKTLSKLHKNLGHTQDAVDLLMLLASDLHSLGRSDDADHQSLLILDSINAALRIVRHKLKHKAKIIVDVPENLSILGKPNRLIQIFINLFTNAARAIRDDNPEENFIKITGDETDHFAVITVTDSGIGIPPEHLEKIFDRFVSLSGLGIKEGSGIGLSIVKELVEEHRGTVEVISQPDQGTSFIIQFPIARDRKSFPPPMTRIVTRDTPQEFIRAKRIILFIDENDTHRKTYERSFGQMHKVLVSPSFKEAQPVIEETNRELDIIVSAITSDTEDFTEFYNSVISRYENFENHFICTSEEKIKIKDVRESLIPVLVRPFRPAELLAAIYRIPPRNINSTIPDK